MPSNRSNFKTGHPLGKASKKRVLVDIFYLHVAQTGIKTYIECLCDEIAGSEQDDFEFIVVPNRQACAESTFFKGKTPFWKNMLFQGMYFFWKLGVLPVLSLWHRADLVFSPDILSPIWAKGTKVSVIHDAFFWENPTYYNALWLKVYLGFLRLGLKHHAAVITISEHSKAKIHQYLGKQLSVHVVYPSSAFRLRGPRSGNSSPLVDPYFLHVGVMEKRKNLLMLLEAFSVFVKKRNFEKYRLVLVGQRGPRAKMDDYDNVLSLIEKLGIEDRVVLPGYLDQAKLEAYYQHAYAYVFPSLNEGFGMPILEAFSYGIPVIVSNQGALKEVGGDAVLTVEGNGHLDFADAMARLAQDASLRSELIAKGKVRLEKFSASAFFSSLKDCLRKLN